MNKTAELYQALQDDLHSNNYNVDSTIHRKYVCESREGIIYSLSVRDRNRSLSVPIGSDDKNIKFPEWKGIEISFVKLPEYSAGEQVYLHLKQMPETEAYIYEIVVEDIRKNLERLSDSSKFAPVTHNILKKWKEFFSAGKKLVMSEFSAQGLYGELLFLKEIIREIGVITVNSWAGVNNETHDFYIGQNAVEIKTTATQAPYMAHINSEYQLDDNDVNDRLYLRIYILRKDSNGGQKLPELIAEIRSMLHNDSGVLDIFNDKLEKGGYFDVAADHYKAGYTLREIYSFEVKQGFPRLMRDVIPEGIFDLEYALSISQCMDFAIEAKELIEALKR